MGNFPLGLVSACSPWSTPRSISKAPTAARLSRGGARGRAGEAGSSDEPGGRHHPRASAGVGRAVAERFAYAGDRIGLIARDADALEETRLSLLRMGAKAAACEPADVAGDADAVFKAAERLEAALGPIDVWVNDAMETVFSRIVDMSPHELHRVTEVCYLGCVHGRMAALEDICARGQRTIVQIGSALAYRGIPLQAAYCAAKHAIRGFTGSLRTELIAEGSKVGVAIVELPAVNTPQFDWARVHIPNAPRPVGKPIRPRWRRKRCFAPRAGMRAKSG